ncbi:oligosaccharide repeat unit polymerase [Photobacterium sp. CCB-ST2H9]|uniref:oligosaccharide repeat unit polymerase n=1 Tax=Photobacterium sp. CCB-ST2H9 TaxID=2912855 RepID=UPI002004032C|nr:oligosaccharide repeat unit polymerase [Photobacterium sp. CCB-ST2H9]UTM56556.1 oligosaccharide repeat unit polymerase [Photobacterium sp. CCB-ST2H9]
MSDVFYKFRGVYLFLLFFCSSYALYDGLSFGSLGGDFSGYRIENGSIYILCFCLLIGLYVLFDLVFYFALRVFYKENVLKVNYIRANTGLYVLIFQLFYYIYNQYYGVNVAGVIGTTSNPVKYIFLIINPDYLCLIYLSVTLLYSNKKKFFYSNLLIYVVSTLSRGWLGGLAFICLTFLIYLISRKKFKYIFVIIIFSVLLAALSPWLFAVREAIRTGNELVLDWNNYIDFIRVFIDKIIFRFQSLSSLYYVMANFDNLNYYEIQPAYMQGVIQSSIYRTFDAEGLPIANILSLLWLGETGRNTAFTSTMLPYLALSPSNLILTIFYAFFCLFLSVFISSRFKGSGVDYLIWYYFITYFINGWFAAYISFLITIVFFMFFSKKYKLRSLNI